MKNIGISKKVYISSFKYHFEGANPQKHSIHASNVMKSMTRQPWPCSTKRRTLVERNKEQIAAAAASFIIEVTGRIVPILGDNDKW